MEEILTNWWSLLEEDIIKTLESYKDSGAIVDFHTVLNRGLNTGVEVTISVTTTERSLTFDIFRGKNGSSNLEVLRSYSGYSFLIPKEATADEVCWEIFICFNEREVEYQLEMYFCSLFGNGFRAEHAPIEEDLMKGIDVYVHGNKGIMPLQLKSSISGQFEHRKNYPEISSLIYNKKADENWVRKWTKILYDAYFSEPRMILHKNSLEAPPK